VQKAASFEVTSEISSGFNNTTFVIKVLDGKNPYYFALKVLKSKISQIPVLKRNDLPARKC